MKFYKKFLILVNSVGKALVSFKKLNFFQIIFILNTFSDNKENKCVLWNKYHKKGIFLLINTKNYNNAEKSRDLVKNIYKIKNQNIKCSIYLIKKNIKHAPFLIFGIKNKSSTSNNKNYNQ